MKLKILAYIIEQLMGDDIYLRADMCLPKKLLAMSLIFIALGLGSAIYGIITQNIALIITGIGLIILGICAFLCYKNQTIQIINDQEFEYSTFLGKKTIYRFDEIQALRKNKDSYTLYVANSKVHIESIAIMSDKLVNLINQSLQNK